MRKQIFKLSFIPQGLFLSYILFTNLVQASDNTAILAIFSCIYQLYYVFFYMKFDHAGLNERLAKWFLYFTITIEAVVVINILGVFNFSLFRMLFGTIVMSDDTVSEYGMGLPLKIIILIIFACVVYQTLYYIFKRIKN